jgi:hypothetical protein
MTQLMMKACNSFKSTVPNLQGTEVNMEETWGKTKYGKSSSFPEKIF